MPTPVSAARQCLTPEAATALDDAVAVARLRGHGQTTSLHMISSLLSLPNSSLREACARARHGGGCEYPVRVQFKALELSLTISLDRLHSNSQNRAENGPPISNSLMAAIKRSQANQRRQPENYTFYQQQQQQKQLPQSCSSSIPVVKVELQNLVISILDDPLVSRVFGGAGFRNFDIKMALLRKRIGGFFVPQVFGCTSRYKRPNPPLFLSNFPFMGCFPGDDENFRRICEIMRREKRRCPLLVGVSAGDALKMFLKKMRKGLGFSDALFTGLRVLCVKDEIFMCLKGDFDDGPLRLKLEEVEKMVGDCKVLVNIGDLNELGVDSDNNIDGVRLLVKRLSELVEVYGRKLWLTGAAASYEVYYKVLKIFPTVEHDWDLEILPITSFKFSMGGSYPRSSLMESFVPLGGFFSMSSETKSPSTNTCPNVERCHLCHEKYKEEVARLSHEEPRALDGEQYSSVECAVIFKVQCKDDSSSLHAKITALGKKWDDICRQYHFSQTFLKGYQNPSFPVFQIAEGKKGNECNNDSNDSTGSPNDQGNKNPLSTSSLKELSSSNIYPKPDKNLDVLPKSGDIPSQPKEISDFSHAGRNEVLQMSPPSITSVTTDLGLGIISSFSVSDRASPGPLSTNANMFISKCPPWPSSSYISPSDPKSIYKFLVERICQQEAVSAVVDTIIEPQKTMGPRNIWIHIRGPDRLGKKKLALGLAEILYGSRECLVYADLSFENGSTHLEALFHQQLVNIYELKMRGTVVDFLVNKLCKKPSVVFLENIDKADLVVQHSLLQAVKKGRLTDLKGREVSISNCIFLGSSRYYGVESQTTPNEAKSNRYAEEDILTAKGSSIRLMVVYHLNEGPTNRNPSFVNKRKPFGENTMTGYLERVHKLSKSSLDLNLPAEDGETSDILSRNIESGSVLENSTTWVKGFEGLIDRTVVFGPVDFDGLSERMFEEIKSCLRDAVGFECSVEIETSVMRQILAGGYLFGEKRVEDWIRNVVRGAFLEVEGKFSLNARSVVKFVGCDGVARFELLPGRILVG